MSNASASSALQVAKPPNHILDFLPESDIGSVKIVVLVKSPARESKYKKTLFQHVIMMDDLGQKIKGVIFGGDIQKLEHTLLPTKTYNLTNFSVKPSSDTYNPYGFPYHWMITLSTLIIPEVDNPIAALPSDEPFVKFSKLPSKPPRDYIVDGILAIVIDVGPKRNVNIGGEPNTVHDFCVMTDEKIPLAMCLWNSVAESDDKQIEEAQEQTVIIRAPALKLTNFYGWSLNSTTATIINIDCQSEASTSLIEWAKRNKKYINQVVKNIAYFSKKRIPIQPTADDLATLDEVVHANKNTILHVRVNVKILDPHQKFYYIGCANCTKTTCASIDQEYHCYNCDVPSKGAPVNRVAVTLYDSTNEVDVVAFKEFAAEILQMSPSKSYEYCQSKDELELEALNAVLAKKTFVVSLAKNEWYTRTGPKAQYSIVEYRVENKLPMLFKEPATENSTPSHGLVQLIGEKPDTPLPVVDDPSMILQGTPPPKISETNLGKQPATHRASAQKKLFPKE